jgi:hypothetical protein
MSTSKEGKQMPFDPFGIDKHHADVRRRINEGEPGLAQSYIGSALASYEVDGNGWGTFTGNVPAGIDAVGELILDVARDEGIASSKVFSKHRVTWMISDREAYPDHFPKQHAEAKLLHDLLGRRPELFF